MFSVIVLAALMQITEPIKKDLHQVMAEKLTAADITFKENVKKLVNSSVSVSRCTFYKVHYCFSMLFM